MGVRPCWILASQACSLELQFRTSRIGLNKEVGWTGSAVRRSDPAILATMRERRMNRRLWPWLMLLVTGLVSGTALPQSLPATAGETLSGQKIVLADAVRGHEAVLIVGFSKDAGDGCGVWAKTVRADPAFAGRLVYQVASLEQAPGFVRGMIKGAMRKGLSPPEQDTFVILTQEEKLWRSYFNVTAEKEPYVVLLEASGKIRWSGHGAAKDLEAQMKNAAR